MSLLQFVQSLSPICIHISQVAFVKMIYLHYIVQHNLTLHSCRCQNVTMSDWPRFILATPDDLRAR